MTHEIVFGKIHFAAITASEDIARMIFYPVLPKQILCREFQPAKDAFFLGGSVIAWVHITQVLQPTRFAMIPVPAKSTRMLSIALVVDEVLMMVKRLTIREYFLARVALKFVVVIENVDADLVLPIKLLIAQRAGKGFFVYLYYFV